MFRKLRTILLISISLSSLSPLFAKTADLPGRVPDELESDGGHMMGFAYGGTSAVSGLGSVKSNPAMLVFDKNYKVTAGYNWPSVGREFYQAGVVDSQTSSIAAGFTYTSFRERFKSPDDLSNSNDKFQAFYDSPIKNRVSVGVAQAFSKFSIGVGGQYVSSAQNGDNKKGLTFGGGIAGLLTPTLRFGLSVENLANREVRDIAPMVYRGGLAYLLFDGDWTAHLDYRQRQRVYSEKVSPEKPDVGLQTFSDFERMAVISTSVRIQDLLRVLGGYSIEVGGRRSSLAGGLALVNRNFSFSYLVGKPYLSDTNLHHALNLEFQLSI